MQKYNRLIYLIIVVIFLISIYMILLGIIPIDYLISIILFLTLIVSIFGTIEISRSTLLGISQGISYEIGESKIDEKKEQIDTRIIVRNYSKFGTHYRINLNLKINGESHEVEEELKIMN